MLKKFSRPNWCQLQNVKPKKDIYSKFYINIQIRKSLSQHIENINGKDKRSSHTFLQSITRDVLNTEFDYICQFIKI